MPFFFRRPKPEQKASQKFRGMFPENSIPITLQGESRTINSDKVLLVLPAQVSKAEPKVVVKAERKREGWEIVITQVSPKEERQLLHRILSQGDKLPIGRRHQDITINTVSRDHLTLKVTTEGSLEVIDHSKNGTWLAEH